MQATGSSAMCVHLMDYIWTPSCLQLRCRDRSVCSDGGVKIVVVASVANRTGFVLTREAFAVMMARPCVSSDDQLLPGLGGNVVQVDFRR